MSGADIWRVIRANVALILLMLAGSSVAGAGAYVLLGRYCPRYTATGYIQVQPTQVQDPMKPSEPVLDHTVVLQEQRTQASLLHSDALLSAVLRSREEIRKTRWFGGFGSPGEAKQDLLDRLVITPIPDTKLVRIDVSCADPHDAKVIVEDVVEQHLLEQRKLGEDRQQDVSKALNTARMHYDVRLKDLADQLREKVVQLSIDGMGTPGRLSARDAELRDLLRNQYELREASARLKGQFVAATAQIQNNVDPPKVAEQLTNNQNLNQYRQTLDAAEAQLQEMTVRLGSEHPLTRQCKARRDVCQAKLDKAWAEARANARMMMLDDYRMQGELAQQSLARLEKQVETARTNLAELNSAWQVYLGLKREEESVRELKQQNDHQLEGLNQLNRASDLSAISWVSRPDVPDIRSFPQLEVVMPLSLVLGLAVALSIAFVRETLDTSVRSPRDIVRVGRQMSLLGSERAR
jgi:uncharacterized protein involved in exopolysaccharide biosynthesis